LTTYDGGGLGYDEQTLSVLRPRLALSLRDPDMEVWESDELDDILSRAVTALYPRVARPMSATIGSLTDTDPEYDVPTGMLEISRIDLLGPSNEMLMEMPRGTWETRGDPYGDDFVVYLNTSYLSSVYTLSVHGYGTYDLSSNFPPEQYINFIMAAARLDAVRVMLPKRASFEKWLTLNQKENVSVNELAQIMAQAEGEMERERSRMKTWRRPLPGRR
jgi:hypothetical protein